MSFNPKLKNSILYEEEVLPNNFGILKAREALKNSQEEYNQKFIEEMNEIKKEKPIAFSSYEDLFDDE